jgi:hypothetical protein
MRQPAPVHYFGHPTVVRNVLLLKDYTEAVKHYTIDRIKGGMRFTCTRCEHSVSTLQYDARDGNLRTQAATAINQHATKEHQQPLMYSSLDPQQRIWRA